MAPPILTPSLGTASPDADIVLSGTTRLPESFPVQSVSSISDVSSNPIMLKKGSPFLFTIPLPFKASS
ncbi:hypothetical protein [Paenibacillus sp. FSL H7-0331]|uniref:hypothetical protein n=1 Tax=Paenibacillus sp. FSL H7-0331 TaxID=1920421 RepID=UPI0015C347C2|nr:hypothetical protein [Paenibacillus sp. FSL H7-0331]